MNNTYSISGWVNGKSLRVTSESIIAEIGRLGLPVPAYFADILRNGIRYSNEDFDTLSAVMRELYKIDAGVWQRIGEAA